MEAAAQALEEGQDFLPALAPPDAVEQLAAGQVEGGEHLAHAVRAGVGGARPGGLPLRVPAATGVGWRFKGAELVEADDPPVGRRGSSYSSRMRFFLASKSGSGEAFHVLVCWKVMPNSPRMPRSPSTLMVATTPASIRWSRSLARLQVVNGKPRSWGRLSAIRRISRPARPRHRTARSEPQATRIRVVEIPQRGVLAEHC